MNPDGLADRLRTIFISELEDQLRSLNQDLLAQEKDPADPRGLESLFRIVHTLKGAASAAHVEPVARVCHLLESRFARARDGTALLAAADFGLLFRAADFLADSAQRLRAGDDVSATEADALQRALAGEAETLPREQAAPAARSTRAEPISEAAATTDDATVRVARRKLDALLASAGQLRTATGRLASSSAGLDRLQDGLAQHLAGWNRVMLRLRDRRDLAGAGDELREAQRIRDELVRLVEEAGSVADRARADHRLLGLATDEIGESVHRIRLRPFSDACIPLPRAVRDLAAATGREARIEISGGAVEADRAVIDVLAEVLLHLVRNAVDHGLEPADERETLGKAGVGTITVAAAHAGARLAVTVSDDGAGVDLAAIRARMISLGESIPTDPAELARALFRPGFTTRRDVNSISGRGVGLDAVRASLQRIGGTVDLTWEAGQGTTVRISCPLTLSTLRVLLVEADEQLFAIPTAHVERLFRIPARDIQRIGGRPAILTADSPVPLVSLGAALGAPHRSAAPTDPMRVVLLQVADRRIAVRVDELVTEEEIMLRPLRLKGRTPPPVAGAAILSTGEVALVLDASAVVEAGLRLESSALGLPQAQPEIARIQRILVVDDSITTRTLEESILRAAGFEIETAADGEAGWRLLQERAFDLVVSDVEMPRMDGFALCRAIRGTTRLAEIPVVLVSALESAEHRARGLEAGANAYLAKSSFDQQDLLDTIHQLLG